jgi:hypothetical protein
MTVPVLRHSVRVTVTDSVRCTATGCPAPGPLATAFTVFTVKFAVTVVGPALDHHDDHDASGPGPRAGGTVPELTIRLPACQ